MIRVAALFVDPSGPYADNPHVDLWDIQRDARRYSEKLPVVAHPPCGRWGKMAPINQKRWGTKIGEDGGCFRTALINLFRCGGVLEHPANSLAWPHFGLPRPNSVGWNDHGGLWVCEVWQSAYGHPAHKRTWLLYVGKRSPFPLDWRRDKSLATHQVGGGIHTGNRSLPRLSQDITHLTPPGFADVLIALSMFSSLPRP